MHIRFIGALVLVVLISLAGVALEKRNLELRRAVSRQTFRMDVLQEQHAAGRLRTQQLGAPERLIKALEEGRITPAPLNQAARLPGSRGAVER